MEAKKEAEKHIDQFFLDECRSHGLTKRALPLIIGVAIGVGIAVPLMISGVLALLQSDRNSNEIRKLKERIKFVEYQTGLFNDTATVIFFQLLKWIFIFRISSRHCVTLLILWSKSSEIQLWLKKFFAY